MRFTIATIGVQTCASRRSPRMEPRRLKVSIDVNRDGRIIELAKCERYSSGWR